MDDVIKEWNKFIEESKNISGAFNSWESFIESFPDVVGEGYVYMYRDWWLKKHENVFYLRNIKGSKFLPHNENSAGYEVLD